MIDNRQEPPFTLEEIGEHFGRLLSQEIARVIMLKKALNDNQADNAALSVEVDRLRAELHTAQVDLVACQGDLVVARSQLKGAENKIAANEAAIAEPERNHP